MKSIFHTIIPSQVPQQDSHFKIGKTIMQFLHFTVLFSVKYLQFHFTQYLCNSKIFALNTVFNMGNKNRRSMRVESQLSDNRLSTSNSENRCLRRKHASNNEIDNDKNQDNRFQSSEIQEADDHIMTGGLGLADYHRAHIESYAILQWKLMKLTK